VTQKLPSHQRIDHSAIRSSLLVLLAYFFLTGIMTWPAILHLTDAIPGDGFDGWQNYWNLWWVKQALLVEGANPFFTDYLYPPYGVSLLFHTLNIFNGLWTLPIQLNFGLAVAYHSVVFLSFGLAGYGAYLLSLYTLTRLFPSAAHLRLAAFAGGTVFTMSPFHLAHLLGHMQVFSMIWLPFYVLWLLRTLDTWNASPTATWPWRDAGLSLLFLILASLVDWYHTLYLLIFTGLALLWTLWRRRNAAWPARLRPVWLVLAIGLAFGLLLAPLILPMIREASARADLETGLFQNISLSADLLAFITPSEMHPIWGDWAKKIADNFSSTTSERLIFAGYLPLALAGFITLRSWANPIIRFWVFILLVFFILALGPYLHIGGQIMTLGQWQIPLPYLLLYETIPFINLTRSLSRYDLMIMLSLGALTAAALGQLAMSNEQLSNSRTNGTNSAPRTPHQVVHQNYLHNTYSLLPRHVLGYSTTPGISPYSRNDRLYKFFRWITYVLRFMFYPLPNRPYLIPLLATLLICFEFLAIPYPVSKIDIPQFYVELGQQADDYVIAELPMNWDRPTPLLHQTVHGKPLLTAYTSRDNPLELAWRTPVFQHWRYLGPDIIDQPLLQIAPTIFYDFNLRYIVLDYWQMPPGPEREGTERWVAAALPAGLAPVYNDGRLKVYQTPPRTDIQPYLSLGNGWGARQEQSDGSISRAMNPGPDCQTELFLHHPQNQALILEISAAAASAHTLVVLADHQPVGKIPVVPSFSIRTISLPPSAADFVKISFCASSPTEMAAVRQISLKGGSH